VPHESYSARVWEEDDGWHWSVTTSDRREWSGEVESVARALREAAACLRRIVPVDPFVEVE
jgi:hypothetical protein